MSSRRPSAAALVLLLVACAEPGESGPSSPSEQTTEQSASNGSVTVPPSTESEAVLSPLERHDVPPGGIQRLLSSFLATPGPCINRVPAQTPPGDTGPVFDVEVAQRSRVCFDGFDSSQPIHVVLLGPDGSEVLGEDVTPRPQHEWSWTPLPGEPKGDYAIIATQGPDVATPQLLASGILRVQPATLPSLVEITPSGIAGSTFSFGLAGFPPSSTVRMFLYASNGSDLEFQTELETVTVDTVGELILRFETEPDDPVGSYAIVTDPPAPRICGLACARFEVTS
jgi:hypothetical protein